MPHLWRSFNPLRICTLVSANTTKTSLRQGYLSLDWTMTQSLEDHQALRLPLLFSLSSLRCTSFCQRGRLWSLVSSMSKVLPTHHWLSFMSQKMKKEGGKKVSLLSWTFMYDFFISSYQLKVKESKNNQETGLKLQWVFWTDCIIRFASWKDSSDSRKWKNWKRAWVYAEGTLKRP